VILQYKFMQIWLFHEVILDNPTNNCDKRYFICKNFPNFSRKIMLSFIHAFFERRNITCQQLLKIIFFFNSIIFDSKTNLFLYFNRNHP